MVEDLKVNLSDVLKSKRSGASEVKEELSEKFDAEPLKHLLKINQMMTFIILHLKELRLDLIDHEKIKLNK